MTVTTPAPLPEPVGTVSPRELAALLSVNVKTIYAAIASGHIPAFRAGPRRFRIPRSAFPLLFSGAVSAAPMLSAPAPLTSTTTQKGESP